MQLKDRSGIMCDACGTEHRNDFTYYSYDMRPVHVHQNLKPSLDQIFSQAAIFSLDICAACFEQTKAAVRKHYQPRPTGYTCDLSGAVLLGTYDMFHCCIDKVLVKVSGQPLTCAACHATVPPQAKQCPKCRSQDVGRVAAMHIDRRHVELYVGDAAYHQLVDRASAVRTTASNWATTS